MEPLTSVKLIGLMAFAYLCGSIPSGVILTRLFSDADIRHMGSGNIGATNVRRLAGNTLGVLTLIGDVSKGAVPVLIAKYAFHVNSLWSDICISAVALCAVVGHLAPIFFRFRLSGKGVATALGVFIAISPEATGGALLIFLWVVWRYRYVSLGSLSAVSILPALIWLTTGSIVFAGLGVLIAICVVTRHADNIRRLREGTEPTLGQAKNK